MLLLPQLTVGTGVILASAIKAPVSPWISRKIVHIGIGTLLIHADVADSEVVAGIYTAGTAAAGYTAFKGINQISKGREMEGPIKDIGIFGYTVACMAALLLSVSYSDMAPLFYADPAGAIVGRSFNTTKIYDEKSIGGTGAVFATAALTTDGELEERVMAGSVIALIELFGGKIDNSLIALYLIWKALSQV